MKITNLEEDLITFDDGSRLEFYHEQDCCEKVYADCKNIQSLSSENYPYSEVEFDNPPQFSEKEEVGVIIIARNGMRYLISCYDIQNGYYNSNLSLDFIDSKGNRTCIYRNVEKSSE